MGRQAYYDEYAMRSNQKTKGTASSALIWETLGAWKISRLLRWQKTHKTVNFNFVVAVTAWPATHNISDMDLTGDRLIYLAQLTCNHYSAKFLRTSCMIFLLKQKWKGGREIWEYYYSV